MERELSVFWHSLLVVAHKCKRGGVVCSLKGRFHHLCPPCVCVCVRARGSLRQRALISHFILSLPPCALCVCQASCVSVSDDEFVASRSPSWHSISCSLQPVSNYNERNPSLNLCQLFANLFPLSFSLSPLHLSVFVHLVPCYTNRKQHEKLNQTKTTKNKKPHSFFYNRVSSSVFFFFFIIIRCIIPPLTNTNHIIKFFTAVPRCRAPKTKTKHKQSVSLTCLPPSIPPLPFIGLTYWMIQSPKKTNSSW